MYAEEQALLDRYTETGDPDAFRGLVEGHRNMVYAVCRRVLGDAAEAEDAAQECFLQLAIAARKLKAPIAGWLHCVATFVSIDLRRRREARLAREARIRAQARADAANAEATWEDLKGDVDAAINTLPDDLRVPVILYYLEGRKQEEIGERIGLSTAAVSRRLQRGVERLRKRLRKAGWAVATLAISALLLTNASEKAPPTLVSSLGKMALSSNAAQRIAAGPAEIAARKRVAGWTVYVAFLLALALAAGGSVVLYRTLVASAPRASQDDAPSSQDRPLYGPVPATGAAPSE